MIVVSDTIKQICNRDSLRYREYIILTGTTDKIEIKGKLYQSAYKDTHFIGTFNLNYIKFTTTNDIDYKKKEFDYYKEVNGNGIKIGHFIVTEVTDNDTNEEVSVTAYDNGLKFANLYETSLDYDSGTITLKNVLDEICNKVGVELQNESITNGDFIVDSNQFVSNEQFGDVISAIAFISGDFATINADGELEFIFFKETDEIIEDYIDLDDKRDTHPITSVSLGMENVEGENVVLKDEELIAEYGEHWLIINDDPFAYTQEKREQLIQAIFDKVKGFGYSSFKSEYSFKPYLTLGDKIQFRNKEGQLVESVILRLETDYDKIVLEAPSVIDATVKYENPLDSLSIARRAEIKVNKQKSSIEALTESVEVIHDDLNENYYTVEQTNELIQTAESGLTNTFSTSGGSNLIRNSALLFKESDGVYEYWEGSLKRNDEEDDAETGTALLIQTEECSQTIEALKGNYYLSFKYKKLIELSNLSIFLNNTEYPIFSVEDEINLNEEYEYELPFSIEEPSITIKFISNTNNGAEIYDLMLNKGTVKAMYSQHQNETTTDTVKIGKGIRVESTETDTVTKIDSDGFRVLNKNNEDEVLLKATDKGTYTKTLDCEGEATISGLFIQEVDGQVWITGL